MALISIFMPPWSIPGDEILNPSIDPGTVTQGSLSIFSCPKFPRSILILNFHVQATICLSGLK